jgi:nucleoside-diphosphate-sugar epimerase
MMGSRSMSEGLLNLLENSVRTGVKRFVYISSSMVYGDFEDDATEDAECDPLGQYGIMKLAGEWLVKDYTRRTGMEHVILRPSAVYGPLDVYDRVVSKFLIAAMRDETIMVNGAKETLDFTYVDDVADGIVSAAITKKAANNTYNITRGESKTLSEAAKLAVKLAGKGTIKSLARDENFPSRGALNIDRARKDLKFDPRVDIKEGFENYYRWLKDSVYWSQKTIQQPKKRNTRRK